VSRYSDIKIRGRERREKRGREGREGREGLVRDDVSVRGGWIITWRRKWRGETRGEEERWEKNWEERRSDWKISQQWNAEGERVKHSTILNINVPHFCTFLLNTAEQYMTVNFIVRIRKVRHLTPSAYSEYTPNYSKHEKEKNMKRNEIKSNEMKSNQMKLYKLKKTIERKQLKF
jgi:hypothetical protein